MADLKKGFEKLNFKEVKTYRNSGNVIFSSNADDMENFINQIETMIKKQFNLNIPVLLTHKLYTPFLLHQPQINLCRENSLF